MSRKIQRLDVHVLQEHAGLVSTAAPLWTFGYRAGVEHDLCLTMPRSSPVYSSTAIFPVFEQCMPEMDLGIFPGQLWKLIQPDEMGVLWAAGNRRLGRLRFAEPGANPTASAGLKLKPEEFSSIEDGEEFFMGALSRLAYIPGIAGVQPKSLLRISALASPIAAIDTHILKAAKAEHPWIPLVESLCMQGAAKCKIEVPDTEVTRDGRLIAVKRFDSTERCGSTLRARALPR